MVVCVCRSQFIPQSASLFSTSAFLFLPCKWVRLYHFSRCIYVLIYNICFSVSHLLHSGWQTWGPSTSLQMTQVCSFLWLSHIPLCMHNHIFSIQSSLDGQWGCCHVLALVNSVAVTIGLHLAFIFLDLGLLPKAADFELPAWIALYTTHLSLSLPILLKLQVLLPQNSLLWWSQFTLVVLFLTLAFSGCIAKLASCHVLPFCGYVSVYLAVSVSLLLCPP